jgi:hypothetical protein
MLKRRESIYVKLMKKLMKKAEKKNLLVSYCKDLSKLTSRFI